MDKRLIPYIQVILENRHGRLCMGGSSSPQWRITEISGLGLLEKNFSTVTYPGESGQQTLGHTYGPRTISISGVIMNDGNLQRTLANAIHIFQDDVTVKLQFGERKRKTLCHVAVFENNERNVYLQHFVLQLIADNPFFEDWEDTSVAVYKRENLLKTTFTLPCVFSKRTNEIDVLVTGQENSEPVILIANTASPVNALEESGIELTNTLPGGTEQRIFLETTTQAGEIITVNIPERTVTSNLRGNLLNTLSNDSFLSDFYLAPGTNRVSVTNYNTFEDISVLCQYNNRYLEAVY